MTRVTREMAMNLKSRNRVSAVQRALALAATLAAVIALTLPGTATGQTHPSVNLGADAPIDIVHIKGQVHLINVGGVDGINLVAHVGDEGILLIDSGPAAISDRLLQAIRARFGNKYIQYLVNTSADMDHIGGNTNFAKAVGLDDPGIHFFRVRPEEMGMRIVSGLKAQQRMTGAFLPEDAIPNEGWPVSAFSFDRKEIHFNGEPIMLYAARGAHTDGDIVVFFRSSDVIVAGDTFVLGNYPVIDAKRGGTLKGLIEAAILMEDLAVAEYNSFGGTVVIPAHGSMAAETDVIRHLQMLTIIRDRVEDMIKKGMTLDQIKAARPTLDYDGVYGGNKPFWTPTMFLEAVYRELSKPAPAAQTAGAGRR